MEKTMKAVVTYAPGDNRYEDFPMPELEDGEVLLKVKGCGICANTCPFGAITMVKDEK